MQVPAEPSQLCPCRRDYAHAASERRRATVHACEMSRDGAQCARHPEADWHTRSPDPLEPLDVRARHGRHALLLVRALPPETALSDAQFCSGSVCGGCRMSVVSARARATRRVGVVESAPDVSVWSQVSGNTDLRTARRRPEAQKDVFKLRRAHRGVGGGREKWAHLSKRTCLGKGIDVTSNICHTIKAISLVTWTLSSITAQWLRCQTSWHLCSRHQCHSMFLDLQARPRHPAPSPARLCAF